jgi:hypothetical protein
MHFDGSRSNQGNGAGIILLPPVGKIHNLFYRLEFSYTNNFTKFEYLLLGIENSLNLGCGHLSVFGYFELLVNLIRKLCSLVIPIVIQRNICYISVLLVNLIRKLVACLYLG